MTENPKKSKLIIESSSSDKTPTEIEEDVSEKSGKLSSLSEPSTSKRQLDETLSDKSSSPIPSSTSELLSSSSTIDMIYEKDLEEEFNKVNCKDENFYSKDCNKFLLKKELVERNFLANHEDDNAYLYPNLNDTEFNVKIATKKEWVPSSTSSRWILRWLPLCRGD
jgi:hypothetical protein